jgi:hypothetical protein
VVAILAMLAPKLALCVAPGGSAERVNDFDTTGFGI